MSKSNYMIMIKYRGNHEIPNSYLKEEECKFKEHRLHSMGKGVYGTDDLTEVETIVEFQKVAKELDLKNKPFIECIQLMRIENTSSLMEAII